MNGEIIKLLEMCKNGTLTVEATEELLDAIYKGEEETVVAASELPWENDDRIHIVAYLGHEMLSENTDGHNGLFMISYDGDPKDVICTCGDFSCGMVRGDVTARDVSIGGDVNGSVTASGKVTVSGAVKGYVNGRYSAEGVKVSVNSDDLKNLGSSISEMVKHSIDFATDAVNSANEKMKNKYRKSERTAAEDSDVIGYDKVSDIPDDGAIRIAVLKGNTIIRSSEMADNFTVDMGDYEANDVYCAGSLVCGTVNGDINAVSVTCDEVGGDINASSVTCDEVGGDVTAGENINCDTVEGDINGCQTVYCDDVNGDIRDCERVTCNDVNGDISGCQTVTCDSVDGDVRDCGTVNMN